MKIDINFPLTLGEFLEKQYCGRGVQRIHIDNIEFLLRSLSEVPIENVTLTEEENLLIAKDMLDALPYDEDRLKFISQYCKYCGSKNPNCMCSRDD